MSATSKEPLRLHLGGEERKEGWKILNAQPAPYVDFVGPCDDLSQFADGSVDEVYASHIFEHLSMFEELPRTLYGVARVLKVGGYLRIAVPDLEMLARLLLADGMDLKGRFHITRMIYGGQKDQYDFHKVGYTFEILSYMLQAYYFGGVQRVASFGLFNDCSTLKFGGHSISLNILAVRQPGVPPLMAPWHPDHLRA